MKTSSNLKPAIFFAILLPSLCSAVICFLCVGGDNTKCAEPKLPHDKIDCSEYEGVYENQCFTAIYRQGGRVQRGCYNLSEIGNLNEDPPYQPIVTRCSTDYCNNQAFHDDFIGDDSGPDSRGRRWQISGAAKFNCISILLFIGVVLVSFS